MDGDGIRQAATAEAGHAVPTSMKKATIAAKEYL
jgi:hypothetical protein